MLSEHCSRELHYINVMFYQGGVGASFRKGRGVCILCAEDSSCQQVTALKNPSVDLEQSS